MTVYDVGNVLASTITGLSPSTSYTVVARAYDGVGARGADSSPLSVTTLASGSNFDIRVNAGGPDYTDGSGNIWAADNGFTGGLAGSCAPGTTGTPDPGLFLWERTGMSQYQFTGLTNGTYHVDLLMAETYWTTTGQRVFSATANGQAFFTNLDVFAAAGGSFKAITRSVDVVVNAGTLTLGFTATVDQSLANALHISLPTTGIVVGTASLSATTSLSAIGHGVSTGAKALAATAVLQASAGGTASQGSAGLAAHATLVATPVTGGTINVGNTLAYTIANLLPNTSYTITVRAYDGVGVRGTDSSPLAVTTLTATPTGSATLAASSALSVFGIGVPKGTAPLQAAASLVATASGPIKPGSSALVAHATLFATVASSGPIAGSAAIVASSTLFAAGLNVARGSAPIQAASAISATASSPIKPGSAALVAQATLLATALGSGPIAGSAALVAGATLSTVGLSRASASSPLAATAQLTATGAGTSIANLAATSALAATATAFTLSQASAQLLGVLTPTVAMGASAVFGTTPLVATATLFANPTGAGTRVGSANLLAGSTLYALTVATVRTGSAALHTTPSVLTATGTSFVYVPPLPAAVFAQPRLIVEIAVAVGPNLDAKKTGTPNGLVLDDPNTSLGTSVLGSVTVWTEITSDVQHVDLFYGRSASPLSDLTQPLVGSANITLENFSGNYDPGNPNGTFSNGTGGTLLLPLRQVQIRAEWAGITYPLWRGYIEEYVPDYGITPTTTMQCVGPLAMLAAAPVPKVDPPLYGGEKSGARINRILDVMGWPTSLRDIDIGNTVMPEAVFGDNALRLSQDVAIAEGGLLFTSAQTGSVTFYDRNRILNAPRSLSVQAVFDDSSANNTIDYLSMVVSYGAATIANSITMNRVDGVAQTVEDSTSQLAYGKRELPNSPTNLQLTSDNQTQAVANWFLQQYKDPDLRVTELDAEGLPQSMWPAILGLTLWDRVEVKRRYSAAYSFDKHLLVQGITHTIVPFQSWGVKINTQASTSQSPFTFPPMILDTSSGVSVGCLGY